MFAGLLSLDRIALHRLTGREGIKTILYAKCILNITRFHMSFQVFLVRKVRSSREGGTYRYTTYVTSYRATGVGGQQQPSTILSRNGVQHAPLQQLIHNVNTHNLVKPPVNFPLFFQPKQCCVKMCY